MRIFFKVLFVLAGVFFSLLLILLTFIVLKKVLHGQSLSRKGYVAVVEVSGIIVSAESVTSDIREFLEDPQVKGMVIQINSPGGLVAPSQEIYDAIRKANEKIPVYVSMGSVAASGGYYAALGGRKIFASPGTLTASIGVIMEFINTEKLFKWAKMDRYTLKGGKFKDLGSSHRMMTEEEKILIMRLIDNIHSQFKLAVKERRGLKESDLESVTDGRVLTGEQALSSKLVDELGGLDDAILALKKVAGLPDWAYVEYPTDKKRGLLKRLLFGSSEESLSHLTQNLSELLPRFPGWQILLMSQIH